MLSVVIATHNHERALVPTLAALVAGAVAGVVHEVIVADGDSCDATAQVADGAGCRVMVSKEGRGARLRAAAAAARARWLLFLQPGSVPDASWIDEIGRFIEEAELDGRSSSSAAAFRLASASLRPQWRNALTALRAALGAGPNASQGLVIAKALYDSVGGHRDIDGPERDLIRRLGGRRIVVMRTATVAASG